METPDRLMESSLERQPDFPLRTRMAFLVKWMKMAACLILGLGAAAPITAGEYEYQTRHFQVVANSPSVARDIGEAAEQSRSTLARSWLNRPLSDWNFRCRIEVDCRENEGSGWTNYDLLAGSVIQIGIEMQGSPDRLMDYVLPHEITHAILVTALGKAMPRWADEGAAMTAEAQSERNRQRLLVEQLLKAGQTIPLRKLFEQEKYPREKRRLYAFYAESHSLTEYLIEQGGRARFLEFVRDGSVGEWDRAVQVHYGRRDVETLQTAWSEWVVQAAAKRNTEKFHERMIARDASTIQTPRKLDPSRISP